jgi:hypothetical protein
MARQITEALELEQENEQYRQTLHVVKLELQRLRREYFDGARSLSEMAIDEIDEELETIASGIENALY